MDDVEDVLPLLLGQEPEHGDEIGFDVVEGAPVADEPLFPLRRFEIKGVSVRRSLRTATPEDEIVKGDL